MGNRRSTSYRRVALRSTLVIAAYYASARLGLLFAFPHSNVTPIWPPSGIAVAALFLLGRGYWPALLVAAFAVNVTTGLPPFVAAGLALGNTLEYVFAAALLRRARFDPKLHRVGDVATLAVAALLAPLVAASVGTASLIAGGVVARAAGSEVWTIYLIGDGAGILALTPLLLTWRGNALRVPAAREIFEGALLLIGAGIASAAVFVFGLGGPYLVFPLAIGAAVRFGQRGATLTILVVNAAAIWGTVHGPSFLPESSLLERIEAMQLFLGAYALTALSLAASVEGRRDADRGIAEHAKRLEAANLELEAFAYTIAHDLRAPLRALNGFSTVLSEELRETLPESAAYALQRIAVNASLMGQLIDALLAFARLGQRDVRRERLRPAEIARATFERLSAATGHSVEFRVGDLPPCLADPVLLESVYQNLIENALKFTSRRESACVDAGWLPSSEAPGIPVYYVRDNGVGFDMKYSEKLFGIFSRLHRQDEFPGTGAGLAIAKRIVGRHGGRIWAAAEPGRGATFFFTLGGSTGR